jgi:hypothetical protein
MEVGRGRRCDNTRAIPRPKATPHSLDRIGRSPAVDTRMGAPSVRKKPRCAFRHLLRWCPLTWFKIDDSFYDHPKVFDAPDCAVALWTRAGTWSARNLTDGFVPPGCPPASATTPTPQSRNLLTPRAVERTTRRLPSSTTGPTYQPSAEAVKKLRETRAEAGKRGGQAKAAKQNAGKPLAIASPFAKQNATPTRPLPSSKEGRGAANSLDCPRHRGQRAANCGPCRSEALASREDA